MAGAIALSAVADIRDGAAQGVPAVITVTVDNAKVMRLPEKTRTVIVGNPMVADVSLQKNGVLILTGKSFGATNLIALDGTGEMLAESTISVQAPQASVVMVQRGLDRESYSCTPNCQPSVQLGDSSKYFGEVSGQADTRRNLATSGGK
ncbi:pilus assembly protein [Methylobacterium sp. Leaf399]|nr:pilus assembly protein [Methylobacterium sp. Leaf108]KQT20068.1 pilus assembly protein [Methylobacterium sp. Leaf399]KQT80836.1 pilus assembly protein [Methylobacterium sp. Leaf466]